MTRSGYAMDCPGWIRVTIGEAAEGISSWRRWKSCARLKDSRGAAPHQRPERRITKSGELTENKDAIGSTEMIIVMQKSAPTEEVQRILELLEAPGRGVTCRPAIWGPSSA